MSYAAFLASKARVYHGCGIDAPGLPPMLFPFQSAMVRWALRKGRCALFADTGLGKTFMQGAWADALITTGVVRRVLILAPLCVAEQTVAECAKLGIVIKSAEGQHRVDDSAAIWITNYERLDKFDPASFQAVVLDESGILKAFDGKTRTKLIQSFSATPYRLCCTATPAPNDIAELANHAEFLGVMARAEMLATWFVHVERDEAANGWRLKGHAHAAFYRWLASWGLFLRRPSDLGFSDTGYQLPPVESRDVVVGATGGPVGEYLFPGLGLGGIKGRLAARKSSVAERVEATVALVQKSPGPWIVWCGLNDEQDAVADLLGDEAVSVQGKDDEADKQARMTAFIEG